MAFPGVSSSNSGFRNAATSHSCNLPSNIAAGNLLMLFFSTEGLTSCTHTTPSGWTLLKRFVIPATPGGGVSSIFYKVASGSEGSTVSVTTSDSDPSAHVSYRITGYSGVPESSDAVESGAQGAPNPPGFTPAAATTKDYMWIAVGVTPEAITAAPTDYTDNFKVADGNGITVGVACRNLTSDSENPSSFAATSNYWAAATLAITPDPAAASSPSPSVSPSASLSPSASSSRSMSPSASLSSSASLSPSASTSQSTSPSASLSPSASRSPSASLSASASLSPSASSSRSLSPSASLSPSSSTSPSASSSRSQSPSASPSAPDWDDQVLNTSTFTKQTISFH